MNVVRALSRVAAAVYLVGSNAAAVPGRDPLGLVAVLCFAGATAVVVLGVVPIIKEARP